MANVIVSYDDNVPVLMGDQPPDAGTPVSDPIDTGYTTNQNVVVDAGVYCFCLKTTDAYTPLWRTVQAIEGTTVRASFRKVRP